MSLELLNSKLSEGFQTSAYRGATGFLETTPADDVSSKQGLRFAEMISNRLEPFPRTKPAPTLGESFAVSVTNNKTHTFRDISYTGAAKEVEHPSTTGIVPNGLKTSRGFLETTTSTQRQAGKFDDDVMSVYQQGRQLEMQIERERQALQASEFSTEKPNPWRRSTNEHSNMSNVDENAYRQQYRSRGQLVEAGETRQQNAKEALRAGSAVDTDALVEHLRAVREQTLPRGYRAPSAKQWETSQKASFRPLDLAGAVAANARTAVKPVYDETELPDVAPRREGDTASETASAYVKRQPTVDVETKHRMQGSLNIVHGVLCMSHKFHHPRADVHTGVEYKPSEIVQGQYKPMSSIHIPARN